MIVFIFSLWDRIVTAAATNSHFVLIAPDYARLTPFKKRAVVFYYADHLGFVNGKGRESHLEV